MIGRRTALRSPKKRREQKRKVMRLGALACLCLLAIVSGVSLLLRLDIATIHAVYVRDEKGKEEHGLSQVASAVLDPRGFELFPRRSTVLYPREVIERELRKFDAGIADALFALAPGGQLVVSVTRKKPHAIWCGEERGTTTGCFFLDKAGQLFTEAPLFSGAAYRKYYGAVQTERDGLRRLLDEAGFGALDRFVASLQEIALVPEEVVIAPLAHEVYFRDGSKIVVHAGRPYEETLQNLRSVLAAHILDGGRVGATPSFEYIDLRFNNRVFYKPRAP